MCFGIQDPFVKVNHVVVAEDQVEIFQCLREPETFHTIVFGWRRTADVIYGGMSNVGSCGFLNALEHLPRSIPKRDITRDAIKYEDRLNRLWSATS